MGARVAFTRLVSLAGSAAAGLVLAAGLLALAALAGGGARPAAAAAPEAGWRLSASAPLTCSTTTPTITYTRHVDAWYGSTFVLGSDVTDVTELSDHLPAGLASAIYNDSRQDARLRNGLAPWVTSTTDVSWTLAAGENLSAAAKLRIALASVAPPSPLTAIRLEQPVGHGTFSYTIATWVEDIDGCPNDAVGQARVSYFEQNARAVELVYLPLARR